MAGRVIFPSMYAKKRIGVVKNLEDWHDGFLKVMEEASNELSLSLEETKYATDMGFRYFNTGKNKCANRFVVASGAIYISAFLKGNRISQDRISEVLKVSSVSLRKCYRDIIDCLKMQVEIEDE